MSDEHSMHTVFFFQQYDRNFFVGGKILFFGKGQEMQSGV
jgi:hypothetical protein